MGPEFLLTWMQSQETSKMMKSVMESNIDEKSRVSAFTDFVKEIGIDMSDLLQDKEMLKNVNSLYRTVLRLR